ncbi:hypothetical protein [Desertibacillus haloalkaliphilus]|nr:hypothetical protein [Desertibacillus haloalkaliphilus]MBU8907833.1 hypothetical protein [Desertibacillus haloalkaliphilus]
MGRRVSLCYDLYHPIHYLLIEIERIFEYAKVYDENVGSFILSTEMMV